jgi:hypothetical protein
MSDAEVAASNAATAQEEQSALDARIQSYENKLDAKATRGQGMVESAALQVGEALNNAMEQFEDFVYKGRNVELGSDEPLLTLRGGEAARKRIGDILNTIPAREYQALLAAVEDLEGTFKTGGEAKTKVQDIVREASDAEIERMLEHLTPQTTNREFVETAARM